MPRDARLPLGLTLLLFLAVTWAILARLTPELLPEGLGGDPGWTDQAPALPTLPPAEARRALSHAIADRLASVGLGPEVIIRGRAVPLDTPAGRWSVDHLELYLPPSMAPLRVVHLLEALPAPAGVSLSWTSRRADDRTWQVEAYLDRLPSHVVELVEVPATPSALGLANPPRVALLLDGRGGGWAPMSRLLDLGAPMGVAVTPRLPYSLMWAEEATETGKEVWAHLEAKDLVGGRDSLMGALRALPWVKGVWLAESGDDSAKLDVLWPLLRELGLPFLGIGPALPSRASAEGVRAGVALRLDGPGRHLPWELDRLLALARQRGGAVGVLGDVPAELGALITWRMDIERMGFLVTTPGEALRAAAAQAASDASTGDGGD